MPTSVQPVVAGTSRRPVDDVVGGVADGLPDQRHRPCRPRHRASGVGHVGLGLVGARRVGAVELVGHRVLVGARRQACRRWCCVVARPGRAGRPWPGCPGRGRRSRSGCPARTRRGSRSRRRPRRPWSRRDGRLGQAQATGARRRARGGRGRARVLVQLGLDVVLGRTAHVEVRGVVGVADPAEVIRVGLAGGRVGGLELGQQGVGSQVVGVQVGSPGRSSSPFWYSTLPPKLKSWSMRKSFGTCWPRGPWDQSAA